MAVLPSFQPGQAPDTQAKLYLEGGNAAQNWMTSAASRANIEQQTEASRINNEKMRAALPAYIAKAQADTISAQSDVAAATLMQTLRGQFQSLKPQVIGELADIEDPNNQAATEDGTPDWEDKYHQYEALQSKYGQLKLFPEGKVYYDMIEQRKKESYDMALRHATAQAHLDAVNAAVGGRVDVATLNNETRQDVAEITAGARTESAKTAAGARVTAAETAASGGLAKQGLHEFSRAADDYENAALKEQDPDKAAQYMMKANAFRKKAAAIGQPAAGAPGAGGSAKVSIAIPGSDLPPSGDGSGAAAAPAAGAEPVAPTRVPKGAKTVDVGGKPQQLFKDAQGRLAYKLNGNWIVVEEEK